MKKLMTSMSWGFTMIELMVVIAIIGVLATMVGINISGSQKRSKNAKMIAEMKQVQKGFELYYSIKGQYAANCNTMRNDTEYFPQGTPTDNTTYSCTASGYCACAQLLEIGGERQGANSSDTNCNYVATGGTYFCVENVQ